MTCLVFFPLFHCRVPVRFKRYGPFFPLSISCAPISPFWGMEFWHCNDDKHSPPA